MYKSLSSPENKTIYLPVVNILLQTISVISEEQKTKNLKKQEKVD